MIVAVDDAPDVVAIIPTLGRRPERLAECIAAVRAQRGDSRVAVLVVLNTPEPVPAPPGVDVLRPGLNLGWSGALVHARTRISAPYLWLVQDDMRAEPGALAALRVALDADPGLGLVSPIAVGADGLVLARSCGGMLSDPAAPDFGVRLAIPATPCPPDALRGLEALDYVTSRGMLVRTETWDRVGGMDPGYYPVQWADTDLCARLRHHGVRFACVPSARVAHAVHGSSGSSLVRFLYERHRRRFATRWRGAEDAPDGMPIAVDPELVATVARAATSALLDLAAERDEERRTIAALRQELADMRNSTSWRVTAPLRALSRAARTLIRRR